MTGRIRILEERHMTEIIMYVRDHDGCKKCDLYKAVARNSRMPSKIEMLESAGILTQSDHSRSVTLHLTRKGREVADSLDSLDRFMSDI